MSRDKQGQYRFVMTGFSEAGGSRRFAFDRIDAGNSRTKVTVQADLALLRLYGIHIQELPLLCCEFLEQISHLDDACDLTFSEERMRQHKAAREGAAEQRYRPHKKVPAGNQASPWRTGSLRP